MRRLLYALLSAMGLTIIMAGIDWLFFTEDFGLWTYTLGTMTGMGLALLGLLLSIGMLFSRRKGRGLALGALVILVGVFTFLLVMLVWLATGMPTPA